MIVDESGIPAELQERDQWLLYSEDSTPSKKPLNSDGYGASWSDPASWLSFEEATSLTTGSDQYDGIGFVVTASDPYIALDLDGCLREPREEKPKPWLPDPDPLSESFMQYSTSGTGMHAFTYGDRLPEWWANGHFSDEEHEGVEAYTEKFFIMTGDRVPTAANEIREVDLAPFLADAYKAIHGEAPTLPGSDDSPNTDADLDVYDILSRTSYPEGENKGHPFHPSSTGTNFRVDSGGETFRCWRHGVTGNAAHLLGIEQEVIECGDWDGTGIDSDTWREIFDAGRNAGYDLPDPTTSPDGGAKTTITSSTVTGSTSSLDPVAVIHEAGYSTEDTDLSDINNDEIAYAVASLLTENGNYHVRWVTDNSTIYAYEDGVWKAIGDRKVREICHYALRNRNSQRLHGEVQHSIKSHPDLEIERETLGAPEKTIPVENGLLDLEDRNIRDHQPEDYALNQIPTKYDPGADYRDSEWVSFLRDSVRPKDLDKLQEYAGYLLWHHDQPYGKAMFLIGPTDSGKGTFLKVIESIIGDENIASQSLYELMQTRWGMAELYGKMANIRNEVTGGGLKNVQRFKELTGGGDRVSAERKGQDPFKFEVTQKFLFATNQIPSVQNAGDPFFNRLLFAKFPDTVPEENQDPELPERLNQESAAILNWMLDGMDRLLDHDRFTNEASLDGKRDLTDAWGSIVNRFRHNLLEVTGDPEDVVHKSGLHDLFCEYAEYEGKDTVSQGPFTSELKQEAGIDDGQSRRVSDPEEDRPRVFTGVRVIEEYVETFGGSVPGCATSEDGGGRQASF